MTIAVLDDKLINKIAAGEVVERPASIVKELVENSIDAGSSRINVNISGGGIERIEIQDNGQGIADNEVALAFQRHATSKIINEADLFSIKSMGFRGEALPSIASIARIELFTRSASGTGMHLVIYGGLIQELEPYPTPAGTKIIVKDVFYNTPARRKFLKTPVSENLYIYDIMSKLALSRPDISFSFSNEKKNYFKTPGNGKLLDALTSIYGRDYTSNFLPVDWSGDKYALHGLISKPDFHRINRKNQVFFVNCRLIRSPLLSRAVDEGYKGHLLAREYPAVVLFMKVDPADVDINVHPQKTEVRFRDEDTVFRIISRNIREHIAKTNYTLPVSQVGQRDKWPPAIYWQSGNTYRNNFINQKTDQYVNEADLQFAAETSIIRPETVAADHGVPFPAGADGDYRLIGQCFAAYILMQRGESLFLIDQHAAHERILYNQLKSYRGLAGSGNQILVFPLLFDLSSREMEIWENHNQLFGDMGLEIEALGPGSLALRSAPSALQGRELEFIHELLDLLAGEHGGDLRQEAMAMMACKQAVKAGQTLSDEEMASIVESLMNTEDYTNCPHGRPTIIELTRNDLDRRFKRKT